MDILSTLGGHFVSKHHTITGYKQWSRKGRALVWRRYAGRCCTCDALVGRQGVVDHIVPLSRGGTHGVENLQLLCSPCHKRKTLYENSTRARPVIGPDGLPLTPPP